MWNCGGVESSSELVSGIWRRWMCGHRGVWKGWWDAFNSSNKNFLKKNIKIQKKNSQ